MTSENNPDAVDAPDVLSSLPDRALPIPVAEALAEKTNERLMPGSVLRNKDTDAFLVVALIYTGEERIISLGYLPDAGGWSVIRRDPRGADLETLFETLDEWAAETYALDIARPADADADPEGES